MISWIASLIGSSTKCREFRAWSTIYRGNRLRRSSGRDLQKISRGYTRDTGPVNSPNVAMPAGAEFEPDPAFHRYISHAGGVAVSVSAPLLPPPGAASTRLKSPATAVAA